MRMELTEELKLIFIETAKVVKGAARRLLQARIVKGLGAGGQQRAEAELGWNRGTIRKGQHELASGITCLDAFSARGRKRAEEHLPNLEQDVHTILKSQSQIDPSFKTQRLYIRLSAAAVREQLMVQKGYTDAELPSVRTLSTKFIVSTLRLIRRKIHCVFRSMPKRQSRLVSFLDMGTAVWKSMPQTMISNLNKS
jgi:hypothetical protein